MMVARIVWALTVLASSIHAFKDASPFLAYSSTKIPQLDRLRDQDEQVSQGSQITTVLKDVLSECLTDVYVFAHQPGLSAEDMRDPQQLPYLSSMMKGNDKYGAKSAVAIPEVANGLRTDELKALVKSKCGATEVKADPESGFADHSGQYPLIISLDLKTIKRERDGGKWEIWQHDLYLERCLSEVPPHSYTVVYTSTPVSGSANAAVQRPEEAEHRNYDYEIEDPNLSALHQDLKRDTTGHLHQRRQEDRRDYDPPLFEKYNFLSPGIFMSLFTGIILFSILSVGMSGIASVRVSYMAFSKEMGPAAQKKQQQ